VDPRVSLDAFRTRTLTSRSSSPQAVAIRTALPWLMATQTKQPISSFLGLERSDSHTILHIPYILESNPHLDFAALYEGDPKITGIDLLRMRAF
jgi:hypothetical protein